MKQLTHIHRLHPALSATRFSCTPSNCRKIFTLLHIPDLTFFHHLSPVSKPSTFVHHRIMSLAYVRQTRMQPSALQTQAATHSRQMQQFYLHKLFDLLSDAEFLPLIPSDPVATAIQMQESASMAGNSVNGQYLPHMSPAIRHETVYNGQKTRRYSGQFLRQHLFGGKRTDYAQYRSG